MPMFAAPVVSSLSDAQMPFGAPVSTAQRSVK